jgi:hypothetical protein
MTTVIFIDTINSDKLAIARYMGQQARMISRPLAVVCLAFHFDSFLGIRAQISTVDTSYLQFPYQIIQKVVFDSDFLHDGQLLCVCNHW